MIKPKAKGTKVVIGPCRLSYTHLFQKYTPKGSADGKYMTNILIPKGETETLKAINKAVEEAKNAGITSKWGGKLPKSLDMPLRDGDDRYEEKGEEVYKGMSYLNAKASTRPGVVDKDRNPIVDEEEIYSGVWAYVSVEFYPYDVNGNKGVAAGLGNVMKFKDGDRLGGRVSADADFDGIEDNEEDEDL